MSKKNYTMPVTIIPDFLTIDEVNSILTYFNNRPYDVENIKEVCGEAIVNNRHKNNDYNLPGSLVREIVYSKLEKIVGPHIMDNGSLLESHYPYAAHLDTHQDLSRKNFHCHSDNFLNQSVLLSLNEDPSFKTVMFDYFADLVDYTEPPVNDGSIANTMLDPKYANLDFSHMLENQINFIKHIQITDVYNWKTGSAIIWPRNQLHTSSNFYHSGKQKKAIVLFL